MLVAVTGGREYSNKKRVFSKLSKYHEQFHFTHLLHGDSDGLDRLAGEWGSRKKGVQVLKAPAHWDRDGRAAGPIRNSMMAMLPIDVLLVFPGGTGTADMMKKAKAKGIRCIVIK